MVFPEYRPGAFHPVSCELAEEIEGAVRFAKLENQNFERLYISSTRDSHISGYHPVGRAVDISRINGIQIEGFKPGSSGFGINPSVTSIVISLQTSFSSMQLGPYINNLGPGVNISYELILQHTTHIHFAK